MNVNQLWNDTDVDKPKKNLSQCHFFHHKSHMHRSGIETGPLPEPRDGHCRLCFTSIMITYNLSSYHREYKFVCTTKTNRLTACGETIRPDCENHTIE